MGRPERILSVEVLDWIEPKTEIARGEAKDEPGGLNMTGSGKTLYWIAVRGGISDWAIYCDWEDASYEAIRRWGQKVQNKESIRRLVPCTDAAFERYRIR